MKAQTLDPSHDQIDLPENYKFSKPFFKLTLKLLLIWTWSLVLDSVIHRSKWSVKKRLKLRRHQLIPSKAFLGSVRSSQFQNTNHLYIFNGFDGLVDDDDGIEVISHRSALISSWPYSDTDSWTSWYLSIPLSPSFRFDRFSSLGFTSHSRFNLPSIPLWLKFPFDL